MLEAPRYGGGVARVVCSTAPVIGHTDRSMNSYDSIVDVDWSVSKLLIAAVLHQ